MNATFEEVSASVRALRPGDRYQLWVQLNEEFDHAAEAEAEIEAAWDREMERRVKDVQEGRVEMIPGDVSDLRLVELRERIAAEQSSFAR